MGLLQCLHIFILSMLVMPCTGKEASVSIVIPNMDYKGVICEGSEFRMECPRGYYIELKDGFFGRTDTSTCIGDSDPAVDPAEIPCQDVSVHDLEVVRDCDGRRQCIFDVTKDVLGINPCPSRTYPKYLNLTYNCIKNRLQSFVCEGSQFSLSCPNGDVMQVVNVLYGRNDAERCSLNSQILTTNCSSEIALERVTSLCNHKSYCEVDATSDVFDDPCEGTTKILEIEIQCASCTNDHGSDLQCEQWKADGECESNPAWMMAHCRKTCWGCEVVGSCSDSTNTRSCTNWAARGECLLNEDWMTTNCQYSCNKCHETFEEPDDGSIDPWEHPDPDLAPDNTQHMVACYDDEVLMECPLNSYVQVYDAFYGRLSLEECAPDNEDEALGQYKPCPTSAAPYRLVSWVCDGRRDCIISALNSVFGEPCRDNLYYETVRYYLSANYSCQACTNSESNRYCESEKESKGCDSWEMRQKCFKTCSQCEFSENCQNAWNSEVDCDFWASSGECEENENWMAVQCAKSCRLCKPGDPGAGRPGTRPPPRTDIPIPERTTPRSTTQTTSSLPVEVCENLLGDEYCEELVDEGDCVDFPADMIKTCRKACFFCVPVTLPPYEADCGNKLEDGYCARIADPNGDNECVNHPDFMAENCRLTCNLCRPLPSTSTESTVTTTTTAKTTTPTTTTTTTSATTTSPPTTTVTTPKATTALPSGSEECIDELCIAWVNSNQCVESADLMAQYCPAVCCESDDVPSTRTTTSTTTRTTSATTSTTTSATPTSSTKMTTTTSPGCVSTPQFPGGECTLWAVAGQCGLNPGFMRDYCTPECCPESMTTMATTPNDVETDINVTCKNADQYDALCEIWSRFDQCEVSKNFMRFACSRSCQFCQSNETTTTTTTTTTATGTTTTTTTPPTTTPVCDNRPEHYDKCDRWAFDQDQCVLATDFMMEYCKRSCGFCPGQTGKPTPPSTTRTSTTSTTTTTTTAPPTTTTTDPGDVSCDDVHRPRSQCRDWAASNLCNTQYMILNCKKSCGLCPTPTLAPTTIDPFQVFCEEPCVNGHCIGLDICQCEDGYTGSLCEEITCPGEEPCHGHGKCMGPNHCVCEENWTGESCETALCPEQDECNGRGRCVVPNQCWCFPHYSGSDCSRCALRSDSSQSCMQCPPCNNGKCVLDVNAGETASYKGCFKDELLLRDLEVTAWKENEENTVLGCIMRCYDYGYKYAGLQYGQECHCGDLFGLYGEADNCDMPCAGGVDGEVCGGLYANSIYQVYTGECQCTGRQWAGALCDKCADGYFGETCDRVEGPTTSSTTTPPIRTRVQFTDTPQATTPQPVPRSSPKTPTTTGNLTYLPLQMRLMQSWSSDYSDLEHRRTKLFMEKIQPALMTLYKEIFPALRDVVITSFSQGSVLVKYNLVFYGPVPNYNSTLKFACEGQEGYQEEPPEGWAGELKLPRGLSTMNYQIPPQTRDPCTMDSGIVIQSRGKIPTESSGPITYCYNNGSLSLRPDGTSYCNCTEGFSGNKCQYERDGISKWISLGIIIAVGTVPIIILLIICCCVCKTKEGKAYKVRANSNGKAKSMKNGDSTASRTFQFYDMGRKSGATTTIKKSHSKKQQKPYGDANGGYIDDPEEAEDYAHRRI